MPARAGRRSAVVIGAGVFGCAAADALARRGWAVTIVEQYAPANARGSSGDRTRQLRHGHGAGTVEEDMWYIRSAARGIELWRELAEQGGVGLIEPTGLVWLSHERRGVEETVGQRLAQAGIAFDRLAPDRLATLFPDIAVRDIDHAVFEPHASVIRAQEAVGALLARARQHGAVLRIDRANPAGAGAVRLDGGETIVGDRVIWACGSWLGGLLGAEAPVRPSWQDVVHWQTPRGWARTPTWFDEEEEIYGFPDIDGLGIKVVTHRPGRTFDVDRDCRLPDPKMLRRLSTYIGRRFPALAGAQPLWARVMPYEMTPDSHFILGPSSRGGGHWLLGGGSGHGFKHAPALAELLVEAIEERAEPPAMLAPGDRFDTRPVVAR